MERIGRVHEHCNHLQARHGLLEELHAFGENVETHTKTQAGHVSARSREALDKAVSNRISDRNRHDGYRAGGLSSSHSCWRERCDDDIYLLLHELRREASQSVVVAFRIAKFEGKIPALEVAEVFKALTKGLRLIIDAHPVQSGLSRRDTRGSVTRRLRERVHTLTDCAWRRLLRRLSLPRPRL